MQINVTVTQAELDEMNVTKTELVDVIITQLDEATLPDRRPAISFSGYNVVVEVIDEI